jgi:transaldolase
VKNPDYPDTMYVDELVAPQEVNTMPEATLDATADHGRISGNTIQGRYDEARQHLAALKEAGVDYDDVVRVLEEEGVEKFAASWKELLDTVKGELEAKAG